MASCPQDHVYQTGIQGSLFRRDHDQTGVQPRRTLLKQTVFSGGGLRRVHRTGGGSWEQAPCAAVRSRTCAPPEAERSPAFLWLEPGKARGVAAPGPPGVCGTWGAQAGLERLGLPRRCWRCSRWSCGSATRRARTGGSGCPGRWLTSSSRCWPSSRCVFPPPPPAPPVGPAVELCARAHPQRARFISVTRAPGPVRGPGPRRPGSHGASGLPPFLLTLPPSCLLYWGGFFLTAYRAAWQ